MFLKVFIYLHVSEIILKEKLKKKKPQNLNTNQEIDLSVLIWDDVHNQLEKISCSAVCIELALFVEARQNNIVHMHIYLDMGEILRRVYTSC